MSIEILVILGLAVHQVLTLWFNGSIFLPIRRLLMRIHPLVAEGINCPICMSVWAGAFSLVLWFLVPHGQYLIYLLAAVDISGLAQSYVSRGTPPITQPVANEPPSMQQRVQQARAELRVGGR